MAAFVSYAQNFEDVMLWRALQHVEGGFYIDVGAYAPNKDSVTRAFYDRGWHGINIEPVPERAQSFIDHRPRDINLRLAISEQPGQMELHLVTGTGLSSLDAEEGDRRRAEGRPVEVVTVEVRTLASIWADHVPAEQQVQFLKVDVEGFERQVLASNDWATNRPWIVVAEATRPTTTEPTHDQWQGILEGAAYTFAYFDGLNRFYVANEHPELRAAFTTPPNVFDKFVRYSEVLAKMRANRLLEPLDAVTSSRSWRATARFRAASRFVRRLVRRR
jgi:FkbM family methyltransferase